MKKRKSGYIQISRKLMESKGVYELRRAEKAEGLGVFMMIVFELAKYEDAIGNEETLLIISILAHKKKSYVWHIIRDFGLFDVDGENFQCRLLRKTFNIETVLGEPSPGGSSTADQRPLSGESTALYKVRAEARRSPIQNTRIQYTKNIGTDVPRKETITSTTDFHDLIEKIFHSPDWLYKIEQRMAIRIFSNKQISDFVKHSFLDEIEMNGSYDDGEPFTESRAKRYFVNWIRPGKASREELNKNINSMLRFNVEQAKRKAAKPFDGYGTIDSKGRRRGPHGEIVPMDAPACMDDMMEWNDKTQCWE